MYAKRRSHVSCFAVYHSDIQGGTVGAVRCKVGTLRTYRMLLGYLLDCGIHGIACVISDLASQVSIQTSFRSWRKSIAEPDHGSWSGMDGIC